MIGGGNSGFEEGLFLTRFAEQVDIVEFAPEDPLARRVLAGEFPPGATIEASARDGEITLETARSGQTQVLDAARVSYRSWRGETESSYFANVASASLEFWADGGDRFTVTATMGTVLRRSEVLIFFRAP